MTFDGTGKLTLSTPTTNTLSIQGSGNGDITISSTAYGPMITTTGSVYAFSQWGNTVQFKVGSGGAADRIGYPMQFYSGISTGNTNALTIYLSFTNLETTLKILLLLISIVYTSMKIYDWLLIKLNKKDGNNSKETIQD